MSKGKLIVLEGIDGSGKSSQYRRLCARMENDGIDYNHIVFPRYDKDSSALIRMYLNGEFGEKPSDVSAYAASTFYAVDRFASYRSDWGKLYENGGIITDKDMSTAVPGVFAAGDCTGKPLQLGKAVGEGNIAALSACAYVDKAGK